MINSVAWCGWVMGSLRVGNGGILAKDGENLLHAFVTVQGPTKNVRMRTHWIALKSNILLCREKAGWTHTARHHDEKGMGLPLSLTTTTRSAQLLLILLVIRVHVCPSGRRSRCHLSNPTAETEASGSRDDSVTWLR